ncbi:hypothetical protein K9U40_10155 [Xanthobacter autotrophicus]|uniref:hypothetical protein n=1 Tax=Xanthobacter TaxID=279 RepID=UPI0024ABAE3C|nr:hypothetical protein [Xanthobacter autotrophicus]MDI4664687.1 hypothetical protein [Xanthobacter autotrophicus]
MSAPVSISAFHRALDIADFLSTSGNRRQIHRVSVDDTRDLVRTVVALARVAQAAADYLVAQEVALDATEHPLDTTEKFAASEAADAAVGATHDALTEALVALGYLILETPETTNGNAG